MSVLDSTDPDLDGETIELFASANVLGGLNCWASLSGYEPQEPPLECYNTESPLFLGATTLVPLMRGDTDREWWVPYGPSFIFGDPTSGEIDVPQGYCLERWPAEARTWEGLVEGRETCFVEMDPSVFEQVRSDYRESDFERGLHAAATCVGPAPGSDPLPCPNGQSDCPDDLVCNGGLVCVTQELARENCRADVTCGEGYLCDLCQYRCVLEADWRDPEYCAP